MEEDDNIGEKTMNKETIITAIVALIVAIFDLLKIFGIAVPIEDNTIYTIVSLIVAAVIYWRNQSWTAGGWIGTQVGRKIKAGQKRGDLTLSDRVEILLEESDEH